MPSSSVRQKTVRARRRRFLIIVSPHGFARALSSQHSVPESLLCALYAAHIWQQFSGKPDGHFCRTGRLINLGSWKGADKHWTVSLGSCILPCCPMVSFGIAVLQSSVFPDSAGVYQHSCRLGSNGVLIATACEYVDGVYVIYYITTQPECLDIIFRIFSCSALPDTSS